MAPLLDRSRREKRFFSGGVRKREDPSFLLETLSLSVMAKDMKEDFKEMSKVSLENLRSMDLALVVLKMLGFVKLRVRLDDCEGLVGAGDGARVLKVEGRGVQPKRAWPVQRLKKD